LVAIYQAALQRDGAVRSARQDEASAMARLDAANGSRWPQVNLSGNLNRTAQRLEYDEQALPDRQDVFRSYGYSLQMTQALYRRDDMARREAARLALRQLAWQAGAAEQALWVRVVQPWFEACQFHWQAQAAQSDVARQQARADVLQRRWREGDAALPDVELAAADLALAQARLAEATAELAHRRFVLAELGGEPPALAADACQAQATTPDPGALETWLAWATERSPELLAARQGVEVARAQVSQAEGGRGPALDLVASDSRAKQGPSASIAVGNRAHTQTIGLQLSLPLFSGGTLNAKVREAAAALGKAQADHDTLLARIRQDVANNWHSLRVTRAHALAAQQRERAMGTQQEALARKWRQGQATRAELLVAEQELSAARAESVRLQGLAVLAHARLQAQSGGEAPGALPPPAVQPVQPAQASPD
jgi:outer membrane protein